MITPYYDCGLVTIYHADCREVLPTLTPGSVDLLLTDPPYGIDYLTSRRTVQTGIAKRIAFDSNLHVLRAALHMIEPLLANNRHAYYFAALGESLTYAVRCLPPEIMFRRVLVWDKGNWGMGDLECDYGQQCEAIIYGMKGRRKLIGPRPSNLLRVSRSGAGSTWSHPTQKPVPLLAMLIKASTLPGETVLDPFMGNGAAGRAALSHGRRYIGIDVVEEYCETTVNRLRQLAFIP